MPLLVMAAPAMRPTSARTARPIAAQPGIWCVFLTGFGAMNGGLLVSAFPVPVVVVPEPALTSTFSSISAFRKTGVVRLSSRLAT